MSQSGRPVHPVQHTGNGTGRRPASPFNRGQQGQSALARVSRAASAIGFQAGHDVALQRARLQGQLVDLRAEEDRIIEKNNRDVQKKKSLTLVNGQLGIRQIRLKDKKRLILWEKDQSKRDGLQKEVDAEEPQLNIEIEENKKARAKMEQTIEAHKTAKNRVVSKWRETNANLAALPN